MCTLQNIMCGIHVVDHQGCGKGRFRGVRLWPGGHGVWKGGHEGDVWRGGAGVIHGVWVPDQGVEQGLPVVPFLLVIAGDPPA